MLIGRGSETGEADQALRDAALIATRLTDVQTLAKERFGSSIGGPHECDVAQIVQHAGAQLAALTVKLPQAFLIQAPGERVVSLGSSDVSQLVQCSGLAPCVAHCTRHLQ